MFYKCLQLFFSDYKECTCKQMSKVNVEGCGEQKYIPKRGMIINKTDYIVLDKIGGAIPMGYQLLAPGTRVAVPINWLTKTLAKLKNKSGGYILKKMVDGLMDPWEFGVQGGSRAFVGTKWEPLMDALEVFGVTQLNIVKPVKQILNEKFATGRVVVKKLNESGSNSLYMDYASVNITPKYTQLD